MKAVTRGLARFGAGRALSVALLLALAALRIWDPPPVEALRLRAFDLYQVLQPRKPALRPAVIVDIDEASLREVGQWPWPRTLVARLVEQLTALGALVVAFDVVFPEPDRTSPANIAANFPGLDAGLKAQLSALPSNDAVFARAIGAGRVVLGQSGLPFPVPRSPDAPAGAGFAVKGPVADPGLISFPGLLRNLPELEKTAAGLGLFTIRPESDGIVRRVPIVMKADGDFVPALSLEMLRIVSRSSAILLRTDEAGLQSVALRGLDIPTDGRGQIWVYFSPHDKARYVSAADILGGRVERSRIAGKLVLIGTSAVGLLDLKTTPIDAAMPGVEVHAQLLESMLGRTVLTSPNYATLGEITVALLIGLAIIGLAPLMGAWALLLAGAVVAAVLTGLSWYYFTRHHILIDFSYPLASSFLVYLLLVFTNYLKASSERRQIRSAFGQYLSPVLVEQLVQSPERLTLGGEERTMTVMFSDIRGFTTISEAYKDDPQGLTTLINNVLTPLTNVIVERGGTIDKYIGDAIMAFWNAPLADAGHEARACEAALAMLAALDELNATRRAEAGAQGRPFLPMNIGIGLNTGPCVVGNMGSDLRFNYSVLGDPVNLASRLESQSKSYRVPVVIGARTAGPAAARFVLAELDLLKVKGKTEPERIFTVLCPADDPRAEAMRAAAAAVDDMLTRYRMRDWDGTAAAIATARTLSDTAGAGLAGFLDLYGERIVRLRAAPPPDGWTGVWVAEDK